MSQMVARKLKPESARGLDVYRVSLELIAEYRPWQARIARFNRRLGAQLSESLSSTPQNIAEAMRRTGKDRAHLLTVAMGSHDEVRALLDVAVAFGLLPREEQQRLDALADRISAMLYRLRQRAA